MCLVGVVTDVVALLRDKVKVQNQCNCSKYGMVSNNTSERHAIVVEQVGFAIGTMLAVVRGLLHSGMFSSYSPTLMAAAKLLIFMCCMFCMAHIVNQTPIHDVPFSLLPILQKLCIWDHVNHGSWLVFQHLGNCKMKSPLKCLKQFIMIRLIARVFACPEFLTVQRRRDLC